MTTTTSISISTDLWDRMSKEAFDAPKKEESYNDDDDDDSTVDSQDDDDDDDECDLEDEAVLAQVEQAISNLEKQNDTMTEEDERQEEQEEEQEVAKPESTTEQETPANDTPDAENEVAKPETTTRQETSANETPEAVEHKPDPAGEVSVSFPSADDVAVTPVKEGTETESSKQEDPISEQVQEVPAAATEESSASVPTLEVGEWAEFTKDIFLLSNFPPGWDVSDLLEHCFVKDERIWKRYFDSRCLLAKACQEPKEESKHEMTPSDLYRQELETAFTSDWRNSVLGSMLQKHTYQRVAKVSMDERTGQLNDATVVSTIFSPYFLPRAVQLCMRYHRRPQDFWCSWHIQFVSLKEHKEDKMAYWRPHLTDMCELCSNGYAKMPTKEVGFMPIEDIDTAYMTPSVVRKIRKWLFGSISSLNFCDDLTLLKYIFGSSGAVRNFELLKGDIGYTWTANDAQAKDMKAYGQLTDAQIESATDVGTNWLEYQCRLMSCSLRPIDQWLDPYDEKYKKGLWGERVMKHRYKTHGIFEQDELIRQYPHKVWERAERGYKDPSFQNKVKKVVGKL